MALWPLDPGALSPLSSASFRPPSSFPRHPKAWGVDRGASLQSEPASTPTPYPDRRTPCPPIPAGSQRRRATRSEHANHPETNAALPSGVIGRNEIAVGGTTDRRIVRPRTAPQHPQVAGRRKVGAAVCRGVRIVSARAVETIFPNVAVHVVEAEPVRGECPGRRCCPAELARWALVIGSRAVSPAVIDTGSDAPAIVVAAYGAARSAIVCQFRRDRRSHIEWAGRPGATGVFPLGFARQAIVAPCDFGQAAAEFIRLIPGNAFHRQAVAFEERRERLEDIGRLFRAFHHHGCPLRLRDRGGADEEGAHSHLALGPLVRPALWLVNRGAHEERPARDRDHVDTDVRRQRFGEQRGGGFSPWAPRPPS